MVAIANYKSWDVTDHRSWAACLGLVHVPLFGPGRAEAASGSSSLLLNGQKTSFALCTIGHKSKAMEQLPGWSWSSNVRHAVILDPSRDQLLLQRWDAPGSFRRFALPSRIGAEELLAVLAEAPPPMAEDVVLYVLRAFRRLREAMPEKAPLPAIKALNALLLGTEAVRLGRLREDRWCDASTLADALDQLTSQQRRETGTLDLPKPVRDARIDRLTAFLTCPCPQSSYKLEPHLLLRHAAGQLYQEAHLLIEQDHGGYLFPEAAEMPPRGKAVQRDVHFTPVPLARALVQQAVGAVKDDLLRASVISVLDPACGSGIFLQEAFRELLSIGFSGIVRLQGFDISPISCAMAAFTLSRLAAEAGKVGIRAKICITERNAFLCHWGQPDLILMNPPFVSYQNMDEKDKKETRDVLGPLAAGRFDKSMAFVWRAIQAMKPGSALATVVPAPLFELSCGQRWRSEISRRIEVTLLGRFQGYRYFRGSMVEPGFIVARACRGRKLSSVARLLFAEEGSEDSAIRGLRSQKSCSEAVGGKWDVVVAPRPSGSSNWMPRSSAITKMTSALRVVHLPCVKDLFDVLQGIKSGSDDTFILPHETLMSLPKAERAYFRPIAGSSTIASGIISPKYYVFYPYGANGILFDAEEQVAAALSVYYSRFLKPDRKRLAARSGIKAQYWWTLVRERHWQHVSEAKIVSKAFGERGSFAYDDKGDYVVLQGNAWLWKHKSDIHEGSFDSGPLPWAYLALLNSEFFEQVLSSRCPRLQGGQFDLSARFMNDIPMPDLRDDAIPADAQGLARAGRQIHSSKWPDSQGIEDLVRNAYRMPKRKSLE